MNKTVTINISGIIFHIEEDAYEKLSKYLNTIKGYFSNTDGGNEIMSDIEARIAEMLQAKTSAIKQVVLMADVDSVIEVMGRPEEFADGSEQKAEEKKTEQTYSSNENIKKRLFRDPDHKAVGGVCSGIAAYFNVDIIWIRLAMFLLLFFGGLSFWVYIILWIVIPEAKTTADKLAMHGEKIDINNISKTVKEEAEQLKNRVSSGNFFDRLGDFLKDFFTIFGKFFVRLVGLILLFFGVVFMLGFMSSIFGFSIAGTSADVNDWINLVFVDRSHYTMAAFGLILFFGIPIIMMIYGGIKLLFKIHYSNRWLNIGAGLIWLIGFIIVLFVGIKTGRDFSDSGKVKEQVAVQSQRDTITLTLTKGKELLAALNMNETEYDDYDEDGNYRRGKRRHSDYIIATNDKDVKQKMIVGYGSLSIIPSASNTFEMFVVKKSRGEDKRTAVDRAKSIRYKVLQNDSVISFDEVFTVSTEDKFRVQEVQVILKVPRGKVIMLDKSLEHFIYDIENVTNTFDGDMVGRRWIMTNDGLACVDCDGIEDLRKKYGHDINIPPPPPLPPAGPVNVDVKDAKVNIDENGIKVESKGTNVKIDKEGIHVKQEKK